MSRPPVASTWWLSISSIQTDSPPKPYPSSRQPDSSIAPGEGFTFFQTAFGDGGSASPTIICSVNLLFCSFNIDIWLFKSSSVFPSSPFLLSYPYFRSFKIWALFLTNSMANPSAPKSCVGDRSSPPPVGDSPLIIVKQPTRWNRFVLIKFFGPTT